MRGISPRASDGRLPADVRHVKGTGKRGKSPTQKLVDTLENGLDRSTLDLTEVAYLLTFMDESLQAKFLTVIVKYTYAGDADLNGRVDVADLGILATNYNKRVDEPQALVASSSARSRPTGSNGCPRRRTRSRCGSSGPGTDRRSRRRRYCC